MIVRVSLSREAQIIAHKAFVKTKNFVPLYSNAYLRVIKSKNTCLTNKQYWQTWG